LIRTVRAPPTRGPPTRLDAHASEEGVTCLCQLCEKSVVVRSVWRCQTERRAELERVAGPIRQASCRSAGPCWSVLTTGLRRPAYRSRRRPTGLIPRLPHGRLPDRHATGIRVVVVRSGSRATARGPDPGGFAAAGQSLQVTVLPSRSRSCATASGLSSLGGRAERVGLPIGAGGLARSGGRGRPGRVSHAGASTPFVDSPGATG
jgi:hypothetical protein